MLWSAADIADAVAAGLEAQARTQDLEQAVYGLDAGAELALHPLVHRALRAAGYGVWPEQEYPGDWGKAKRSASRRCDVVLTPGALPLRDRLVRGTLFDTGGCVDPEAAYWLEIKTVAQFESGGPARAYSGELLSPVAQDVKKLWADGVIHHAGLLLVLFTADEMVAHHDLGVWHRRCLDRGYPVATPAVRGFGISDRMGNGWCAVAVFGVRGL